MKDDITVKSSYLFFAKFYFSPHEEISEFQSTLSVGKNVTLDFSSNDFPYEKYWANEIELKFRATRENTLKRIVKSETFLELFTVFILGKVGFKFTYCIGWNFQRERNFRDFANFFLTHS